MKDLLVYDIEIAKEVKDVPGQWNNPEGMGFGSAVCYSYEHDHYYFYLHEKGMEQMLRLMNEKTVIGFNSIRFDSRVCLGNKREFNFKARWTGNGVYGWENYDIMFEYLASKMSHLNEQELFKWLDDGRNHRAGIFSLNGLAGGTFGQQKSGSGAHAPILYQAQKYDELLEYNLKDVILTKKLFDHIQTYGYLVDGEGRKREMPKEI